MEHVLSFFIGNSGLLLLLSTLLSFFCGLLFSFFPRTAPVGLISVPALVIAGTLAAPGFAFHLAKYPDPAGPDAVVLDVDIGSGSTEALLAFDEAGRKWVRIRGRALIVTGDTVTVGRLRSQAGILSFPAICFDGDCWMSDGAPPAEI